MPLFLNTDVLRTIPYFINLRNTYWREVEDTFYDGGILMFEGIRMLLHFIPQ